MKRVIIALGGNAILNKGEKGTHEEQMQNVKNTMAGILDALSDNGHEIAITHGNGPQVGNIMIQNAAGRTRVPEMPMSVCDAMSQGQLGYFIQQSLKNLLSEREQKREVATIVTQVVVDQNDPAFQNPTKPVGPFYSKSESEKAAEAGNYVFQEDSGRGYRRVVPSPEPVYIVEIETVKELMRAGIIVVTCGGGGIPVVYDKGVYQGIDAVIDKDKTASLLADALEADLLINLTAVNKVSLFFGTKKEKQLDFMSVKEARKYLEEGHFGEGSMRPKIEAIIRFVEKNPERKALITHFGVIKEALEGKNGTWIKY